MTDAAGDGSPEVSTKPNEEVDDPDKAKHGHQKTLSRFHNCSQKSSSWFLKVTRKGKELSIFFVLLNKNGKSRKPFQFAMQPCFGMESRKESLPQTTKQHVDVELLGSLLKKYNLEPDFPKDSERPEPEHLLSERSVSGVVEYIKSEKCKNVIVMCGAGISTAAGIPDFRTPGTGLYDNLQKYNLPTPQSIFDINYFWGHPEPFFALAKELWPGNFKPTVSHYFIKLLEDKNLLYRTYTQNIDTLERRAGISGKKLVEAHGHFFGAKCTMCEAQYSKEWIKERIDRDELPMCEVKDCLEEARPARYRSLVKPEIVFFGEGLPSKFFDLRFKDFQECDLLIIMGTSLKVQPFASLIGNVPRHTPRLLINREKCGETDPVMKFMGIDRGLDFDSDKAFRDVAMLGDCDEECTRLCELLGWKEELDALVAAGPPVTDPMPGADEIIEPEVEPEPETPEEEPGPPRRRLRPRPHFAFEDIPQSSNMPDIIR